LSQLQRLTIADSQIQESQISLTAEQSHYLSRVLRLKQGDRFIVLAPHGQGWLAELMPAEVSQQSWIGKILEPVVERTELPIAITLMVALPKGNGLDEVVRQAAELGVTCIAPVVSDRTLLHPSPQKLDRWRRIAQEATEQSERQFVPSILEPVSFMDSLQREVALEQSHAAFLCVTRLASPHLLSCLLSPPSGAIPTTSITIAIGPEGGWTEAEVAQAIDAGFQPVSLGRRIFRAVTAPLVALSLVAAAQEFDSNPTQKV